MRIDEDLLKERLRKALCDTDQYRTGGKLTLAAVTARAAELACTVVDNLANPPAPPAKTQPNRLHDAGAKRGRLLAVMQSGVPMRASTIMRLAMLTPGEVSWLVKNTPGVVRVGTGLYKRLMEVPDGTAAVPDRS